MAASLLAMKGLTMMAALLRSMNIPAVEGGQVLAARRCSSDLQKRLETSISLVICKDTAVKLQESSEIFLG